MYRTKAKIYLDNKSIDYQALFILSNILLPSTESKRIQDAGCSDAGIPHPLSDTQQTNFMQLSYKARYENGQTPQPFTVDVSFSETGVLISYTDSEGILKREAWPKASIVEKQYSSAVVSLRNGTGTPYKQLDITDQQAIADYRLLFKQHRQKRKRSLHSGYFLLLITGGFLVLLVLSYFYLLPVVADHIGKRFPKDLEIALGEKMYASILEESTIDTVQTEAINHFFEQLHVESAYPIQITVLKDTIVNAFAVPGGGIVVYDAILKNMKTPETLAALLAHEYSHVELKHATRNLFRNLAGYLFVSMVLSDANGIASILLRHTENLRTLKYSRTLEQEADANGLEILKRNHLSPEGMIALFEQLKKQETVAVSETMSTHPDLDARIAYATSFGKQNRYTAVQNDSLNFYFNQLNRVSTW